MASVSADNKAIAKIVLDAFGNGKPKVLQYDHESLDIHVDVLSVAATPDDDLTSYGTIGLSDHAMPWGNGEFPTRIELCSAISTDFNTFPNVISSAAFNIIRSKIVCHPGIVMRSYVGLYAKESNLPHLYFTSPFYWEEKLKLTKLQTKTVTWLMCFPISENESRFVEEYGADKFEDMLIEKGVEVFDFLRESCL